MEIHRLVSLNRSPTVQNEHPATVVMATQRIGVPMETVKAAIEWIPKDRGGRTKPPAGAGSPAYSTVVRFADDPWPPVGIAWSLVVVKDPALSSEYRWIASIHFLVEEAPHESLRVGRVFELYEGGKCVARGTILGDQE